MRLLPFILGMVRALAWPVTVLIIFILFRHQVRSIFTRLSHIRYGDWEARFQKDLTRAEADAKQILISKEKKLDSAGLSKHGRLLRLAEISPRAAIMEAWMEIELATFRATEHERIEIEGHIAGTRHIQQLVQRGLLPGAIVELYSNLRRLRNQAAHAEIFIIPEREAERYLNLASTIIAKLDEVSQNKN